MKQKIYNCRVYLRFVFVLLLCHKCQQNRPKTSLLTSVLQVLVQRGRKSQLYFFFFMHFLHKNSYQKSLLFFTPGLQ